MSAGAEPPGGPAPRSGATAAPPIQRYAAPCEPPPWARGGHAQTILGHVLPARAARVERERAFARREVTLADGDRLVVFGCPGTTGVRAHLFHGLSGDTGSDYVRRAAARMRALGHGVWAVNHRGCGAGRGLAAGPYHSGSAPDLAAVLAASRAEDPVGVHVVVGFSLSGNAALLLAAEHMEPAPDGIVAINPPVDLERASLDIHRGLNRLYELRFVHRLRRAIAERERDGLLARHYAIPPRTSMRELDDLFTAPEAGFADGLDYYRRCSTIRRLAEVDVPTVIVTAADDPFVDARAYGAAEPSDSVLLHVEPTGGHVGYLARGRPWRRWLDDALEHYVGELARIAAR